MVIMTKTITAAAAKARFAEHLRNTEQGHEIVITRHGKAVAALIPAQELAQLKRLRAARPDAGLAGLAGGWAGSEALVDAVTSVRRTQARRPPRFRDAGSNATSNHQAR
jgi:prevent-host-death family protein